MRWVIHPSSVSGHTTVPGDKSISHRALMLAALAEGSSTIGNLATGADVQSTTGCLDALGSNITRNNGTLIVSGGELRQSPPLDAGNSGTTMRLLSGILAGEPFESAVTGDASLRRRPMNRIVEPLELMGAEVESVAGHPPLRIHGGGLTGITYRTPIPSAQIKSCILLAALFADGETTVKEPSATRDHTERLMRHAGIPVETDEVGIHVKGPVLPQPFRLDVPGDVSSAAFFLTGAALTSSTLSVAGVGTNPTRMGFLSLLERMGCRVSVSDETDPGGEPLGVVTISPEELKGIEIGPEDVPGCIDELPVVALLGSRARGTTRVTGASELRVKESDRIGVVTQELRRLGADIRELPDGFVVRGPSRLRGTRCHSHGDHRIAMMLALAGLIAEGETVVEGAETADVSYPGFAEKLRSLGAAIDAA